MCRLSRGDAIQKFDALEIPLVTITDKAGNSGVGFGYTIGTGGTAILELINKELLPRLDGEDRRLLLYRLLLKSFWRQSNILMIITPK